MNTTPDQMLEEFLAWWNPYAARNMTKPPTLAPVTAAVDAWNKQQKRIDELAAQLNQAKKEAETLALAIWRRNYREASPRFELCDSVAGVISQIDNMAAGIMEQRDEMARDRLAREAYQMADAMIKERDR